MPLLKSASRAAVGTNISEMVRSGHPRQQAIAAALSNARRYGAKFAEGGTARAVDRNDVLHQLDVFNPDRRVGNIDRSMERHPMTVPFPHGQVPIDTPYPRGPFGEVPQHAISNRYASGGQATPWTERATARQLTHSGMIHSPVPGRTDKLPISVSGGAYMLPADHVAALGQGNSAAGADILNKMFKLGSGSAGALNPMRARMPRLGAKAGLPFSSRPRADGGATEPSETGVPIIAAGGEYAVPPEVVQDIGGGDLDRGHQIFDRWVLATRKQHIKTLRGLKGPKKS